MHDFKDSLDRTWSITVTVDTVRRVRQLVAVDLMQVTKSDLLERLAGDPVLLVDVLFAACKPQADHLQINGESFAAGLSGDAIDAAAMALIGAIADFFPSPTRKLLLRVIDASRAHQEKVAEMVDARVTEGIARLDATLSTLGASSPSAAASSDTTPAHTPSAS